ncbi:hypothetical protein [Microseira wollei]|uniref:Uncharacterized protein n=1 Tax=Microseira wollei NIES-4236 TaxID=2530354 RepID=A0AAV3XKS8_9CYAN|nr:hypothetical protein [Microseira wollei]GET41655.1 hypothetical protein MiSe_64680 [Microseira wollei NIES-4236]
MNFPPQLQQDIEKWANIQGISTEQFVWQAIAEKIEALSHKTAEKHPEHNSELTSILPSNQAKIYRKEGILFGDAELPKNFDINTFIDELREERIQEQMAL